jgi:hypothetical protein
LILGMEFSIPVANMKAVMARAPGVRARPMFEP